MVQNRPFWELRTAPSKRSYAAWNMAMRLATGVRTPKIVWGTQVVFVTCEHTTSIMHKNARICHRYELHILQPRTVYDFFTHTNASMIL